MSYKAVFHVDLFEDKYINIAEANIGNYVKAADNAKAVLLFNGPGAQFCRADHGATANLSKMLELGVRICVCNNALKANDIKPDELTSGVEIVPAGVVELIDLQNDGWAYIKP